ncbi:DNA-binding protein [Helicostylum pulchrum]|nr:DNA-binding protein [Helicostylum pulchrum]
MSMTNINISANPSHIFFFVFCFFLHILNMSSDQSLQESIVSLTCEFLETWFHQILYIRNLYPRSIFEKEKKFQVPVYIATHPGVQEYISNFVQACYSLIAKDDIRFISLTILQQDEAVEKFVFEINLTCQEKELTLTDLEYYLRSCLVKIVQMEPTTAKNTDNNTRFMLSVEKNEAGYPESTQDWIPASSSQWHHILPLKSIPLFNTFIMESSNEKKRV